MTIIERCVFCIDNEGNCAACNDTGLLTKKEYRYGNHR